MAQSNPVMINPATADPLAQLRDIHLPAPIEAWLPAPGWIALTILALLLVIAANVAVYRHWRRNKYRREGLRVLAQLMTEYQRSGKDLADKHAYLLQCENLLKRVALTRYPRTRVASITGEAWVQFLDRTSGTNEFSMGAGQALIQGSYAPATDVEVDQLHKLARYWIKQHGEAA
jgi:hypothetical protein